MTNTTPASPVQSKMTALITKLAPNGAAFLSAAATAGVIALANRVFHVALGSEQVDAAVTPFASLLVGTLAHFLAQRVTPEVAAVATTVEADVEKDPVTKLLLSTIEERLKADPDLKTQLMNDVATSLNKVTPAQQFLARVKAIETAAAPQQRINPIDVPPANAVPPTPAPVAPAPVVEHDPVA